MSADPDPNDRHCGHCHDLEAELAVTRNLLLFGWLANLDNLPPYPLHRRRRLLQVMHEAQQATYRKSLLWRIPAQRSRTAARDEKRLFEDWEARGGLRITRPGGHL